MSGFMTALGFAIGIACGWLLYRERDALKRMAGGAQAQKGYVMTQDKLTRGLFRLALVIGAVVALVAFASFASEYDHYYSRSIDFRVTVGNVTLLILNITTCFVVFLGLFWVYKGFKAKAEMEDE